MSLLRVGAAACLREISNSCANALDHILKGIIVGRPACHRFAPARQYLEIGERCAFPIAGTQDDGQHSCLIRFMSLNGPCHLNTVAEIGVHEIGADEQENDLRRVEMGHDLWSPFGSRHDIAIRPGGYDPLPFQGAQMLVQFAAVRLILVRVRKKDFSAMLPSPVDYPLLNLSICLCSPPWILLV